jgi:hypothetical protein
MSLRRSTELLARLEKHALDQERLALQALEHELARLNQELTAAERALRGEHAAAWALPGGPRRLTPYLAVETARQGALRHAAQELQQKVEHAQTELQARPRRYKSLELAARGLAARDALEQARTARAEVADACAVRAVARPLRTPAPASAAGRRAPP